MNWLEFTSSLIGSLRWPVAVFLVLWLFRHPLSRFINSFARDEVEASYEGMGQKIAVKRKPVEELVARVGAEVEAAEDGQTVNGVAKGQTIRPGDVEASASLQSAATVQAAAQVTQQGFLLSAAPLQMLDDDELLAVAETSPRLAMFGMTLAIELALKAAVFRLGGTPFPATAKDAALHNIHNLLSAGAITPHYAHALTGFLALKGTLLDDAADQTIAYDTVRRGIENTRRVVKRLNKIGWSENTDLAKAGVAVEAGPGASE